MKEYTPESKKQEATTLLNLVIHDEGIYPWLVEIIEESEGFENAVSNVRQFAQEYFDQYEHFFSVFDMEEVDWHDFTKQLWDFDPSAYDFDL